jgi:hypothetical protein
MGCRRGRCSRALLLLFVGEMSSSAVGEGVCWDGLLLCRHGGLASLRSRNAPRRDSRRIGVGSRDSL